MFTDRTDQSIVCTVFHFPVVKGYTGVPSQLNSIITSILPRQKREEQRRVEESRGASRTEYEEDA
jgi:hypothetical protein